MVVIVAGSGLWWCQKKKKEKKRASHSCRIRCERSESARERRLAPYKSNHHHHHPSCTCHVSRFGLAVRCEAGKQKSLGSIPLRLSLLFKKVVVCGHCLVSLSLTINEVKLALIAAYLNAGVILLVTV